MSAMTGHLSSILAHYSPPNVCQAHACCRWARIPFHAKAERHSTVWTGHTLVRRLVSDGHSSWEMQQIEEERDARGWEALRRGNGLASGLGHGWCVRVRVRTGADVCVHVCVRVHVSAHVPGA